MSLPLFPSYFPYFQSTPPLFPPRSTKFPCLGDVFPVVLPLDSSWTPSLGALAVFSPFLPSFLLFFRFANASSLFSLPSRAWCSVAELCRYCSYGQWIVYAKGSIVPLWSRHTPEVPRSTAVAYVLSAARRLRALDTPVLCFCLRKPHPWLSVGR